MEPREYRRMAELQGHHWWFVAKRRVVRSVLARHLPSRSGLALDAGCGTGAMVPVLREWGSTVGLDPYLPALRWVAGARPVAGDLLRLPLRDGSVHLVGCFDVLYHRRVADVAAALAEIHRVCAPGGHLVITDAAFPALRSAHDVAVHGARRFRLGQLRRMVEAAGFRIVHASYFHSVLFPAAALVRLARRALQGSAHLEPGSGRRAAPPRSDLRPVAPWLNRLAAGLYRFEARWVARRRLPFGLSLVLLARKPAAGR